MKNRIMGELKKVFRPEFLNRIDDVIVFHKLAKDEIKEIVELLLPRIRESMAERELQLELSEEAKDLLVDKGWDPAMGARPLRRAIQRYIEDPLADFVLRSQVPPGSTVLVEPGDRRERRRGRRQAVGDRAGAEADPGRRGRRGRLRRRRRARADIRAVRAAGPGRERTPDSRIASLGAAVDLGPYAPDATTS